MSDVNSIDDLEPGLRHLLKRLTAFSVNWSPNGEEYAFGRDREATSDLEGADVASSLLANGWGGQRHLIALDLDVPAYLVPSSTRGHSHLYIDVPTGIEHEAYMALISLLAHLGVIEPGYANVSRQRGHTALRLPWVKKGQEPGRNRTPAVEPAFDEPFGLGPTYVAGHHLPGCNDRCDGDSHYLAANA